MSIPTTKIAVLLTFLSAPCFGAIAFDAASVASGFPAGTSLTWSHTVGGSNRVLFVGVNTVNSTTSGVTYNGTAMTLINSIVHGLDEDSVWYLTAPATGSNNIVASFSASVVSQAGGISLTGVDQATSLDAHNCSSGTTGGLSVTVTTVADNSWVLDSAGVLTGTALTVGGSQTERWNVTNIGGGSAGSSLGPITPAGAQAMTWSNSGSVAWGLCAASFDPVPATNLRDDPMLLLMGGSH